MHYSILFNNSLVEKLEFGRRDIIFSKVCSYVALSNWIMRGAWFGNVGGCLEKMR